MGIQTRISMLINHAFVGDSFLRLNQLNKISFYKYTYVHAHVHKQASAESAKEINLCNRKQRNRRNEAVTNQVRSANSAPWDRILIAALIRKYQQIDFI